MILGAHFSVRQGLIEALRMAEAFNLEAIQIFGYRRHEFYFDPALNPEVRKKLDGEIAVWRKALRRSFVKHVVIHARHVAILAFEDEIRRNLAIAQLKREVELARILGAHYFIFRLGPYAQNMKLKKGLMLACGALAQVLESLPPGSPRLVLENVPGGGRRMGGTIEEISFIVEALKKRKQELGLCVDLAHLWGAGYKIDDEKGARNFFEHLREEIGKERIVLFHLNNTKVDFKSHIDNHWHLRDGVIGAGVYRYLMKNYPQAIGILETPKDSQDADRKNIDFLVSLRK